MKNSKLLLPALLSIALIFSLILPVEAKSGGISWSPKEIELELFPGTSTVASVTFIADDGFANVSLWVVPELQQFVDLQPQSFYQIDASIQETVVFFVSIPYDTPPDTYEGTLHIRVGRRTVPETLKITLHVEEPTSEIIPETIALPTRDRIYQDPVDGTKFVEDELIIGFVEGTSEETIKAVIQSVNGVFIGSIADLHIYQVRVETETPDDLLDIIGEVEAHVSVDYATLNFILTSDVYPDDSEYDVWNETNPNGNNWGHEFIKLPSAWNNGLTGDPDIRIGIIDSYFNDHDDFGDNVLDADYVLEAYDWWPTHGAMVAGIVGAQGNNNQGIAGVMWDCTLLLYSNTDGLVPGTNPDTTSTKAVEQMNRAIGNGAKIINLSQGELHENSVIRYLANLVYRPVISANPNVLFVFSAGNDYDDAKYHCPSSLSEEYANVISVAAIQQDGNLNLDSNNGDAVTVAAPGQDIITLDGSNWYNEQSGTSISAPFVTGLAGLIWSVNGGLPASQVKQIVIDGAEIGGEKVPGESFYVINAKESLRLTPLYFPDPNLEAAIREAIGKPTGPIYPSDLEGLTSLNAQDRNITDLTGLEYCTSLTKLNLWENQISDIQALSNLTSLTELYIIENQISNIQALSNLTSLTELYIGENQISNIQALSNLTSLTNLDLSANQISDISPLANLTNLTELGLGVNQISEISLLANLTNLAWLRLGWNQISDISPLANLTNLIHLHLGWNQISETSPLAYLTNLTDLILSHNQISDISPLVQNEGLDTDDYIWLTGNPLSSSSINIYIPQLEARGVNVFY